MLVRSSPRSAVTILLLGLLHTASGCNLDNSESLNRCVVDILESSRVQLREQFDPLHLADISGSDGFDWHVSATTIHGLAGFSFRHLHIHPSGDQIRISFHVHWPSVVGNANAKLSKCKRIFRRRRCFTVRGRPRVTLRDPSAILVTTLHIYLREGRMVIVPRGTDVSVNLPGIDVDPRLRGLGGILNKVFRNPAQRLATGYSIKFWEKNKSKFENLIKEKLNNLVSVQLSDLLSKQLTGFNG